LDDEGTAASEFASGKISNVMGFIYNNLPSNLPEGIPRFQRDDVESIIFFMKEKIQESIHKTEMYGLILTGGQSSRMGTDKSLIHYHGAPQARYLHQMMESLKIKTFISCREDQVSRQGFNDLPTMTDRFINFGPLGGILSAMANHPDKAWFVLACDLPLVTEQKIEELIKARNPLKQATAFFNQERKQFEPLFAIYEPRIYSRLLHFLGDKSICPQKALFNSVVEKIDLPMQGFLENANTPEERERLLGMMRGELV